MGAVQRGFADENGSGGGISNEEGADQIRARIADWQNDLDSLKKAIPGACAVSDLDSVLLPNSGNLVSPEFAALERVHPKLSLGIDRGAKYPLNDGLIRATAQVRLTPDEKAERDRLRAREASDETDVLGLEIEGEKFLIRVVNRIYDSAIDYSLKRASNDREAGGVFGSMYSQRDLCVADTIQSERDVALMSAASSILPVYDELAAEESGNPKPLP